MDKSFVSLEQHQCFVCGTVYETGNLLLDKRVKNSMDKYTVTGHGLCPEHQELADKDYIALIVVKADRETRTGQLVHLKREVMISLFDAKITGPVVYIDEELFSKLQIMAGEVE